VVKIGVRCSGALNVTWWLAWLSGYQDGASGACSGQGVGARQEQGGFGAGLAARCQAVAQYARLGELRLWSDARRLRVGQKPLDFLPAFPGRVSPSRC